jgi:formiminoglutamate deiminase
LGPATPTPTPANTGPANAAPANAAPAKYYFCDYAWLGGETVAPRVTLQVMGSTIEAVSAGGRRPEDATHLAGLTLPGFANTHSHAFHRALRSRAERARGSFWTWRDLMYSVADRLTPERYFALARAVYAEMALAGFTVVGEFHYLHHAPGGARYGDPNDMGRAVLAAGREAGVRVVLLDACYLEAGPGRALEGVQLRFGDGSVEAWAERAAKLAAEAEVAGGLADSAGPVIGAAVHSMRAVPPAAAQRVAEWAAERASPLHFHCSEQPAENNAVLAAYGATPVQLLARAGALRPGSVAVHATHLTDADAEALGGSRTGVCLCPTTERDLGDGIGPARRLFGLGSPVSLGSDSHAVVDPFEEMRALELDERLASLQRGNFTTVQLVESATSAGYHALGHPAGGRLRPGALADFVTISLDGPSLAGTTEDFLLEAAVFAAGPRDVTEVVVGGRPIVERGRHLLVGDVGSALRLAIDALQLS